MEQVRSVAIVGYGSTRQTSGAYTHTLIGALHVVCYSGGLVVGELHESEVEVQCVDGGSPGGWHRHSRYDSLWHAAPRCARSGGTNGQLADGRRRSDARLHHRLR